MVAPAMVVRRQTASQRAQVGASLSRSSPRAGGPVGRPRRYEVSGRHGAALLKPLLLVADGRAAFQRFGLPPQ